MVATALLFALAPASFLQPTVPSRAFTTRSVQRASVPLALNTGSYRILSPCTDESVLEALVDGSSAADTTGHWVVIMPGPLSLGPPPDSQVVPEFIASYDKPVRDGEVPLAAGRLRVGARMVERFSCSLPKEDPRHLELLGVVLDQLLLAWLQALPTAAAGFEELGAAANLHSAAVVERVGFAELESPDLTSLGRGEPIRTHGARLPAAIVAYEHRLARLDAGDVEARAAAQRILDALRAQEAPAGGSGEAAPPVAEDDDPWSAMRASSGY